ncbi:hypothetical protein GGS20DRAFT_596216 [Poronia punctata]|nr:hypothetical protein GGS20DRAFT_596216 [Poronia punctata]
MAPAPTVGYTPMPNKAERRAPNPPVNIETIVLFERLGAAFSVMGVLWIFLAFATLKRVRTIPNTFIVFASFANLGASIACLIGYSGVLAGSTSPLCQAQAFMFELFMQSDPWWSFAMAVNVYLVFFYSADPKSFLRYWYVYFIVCYGVPLIPALCLLLFRRGDGTSVYGNATIWCWIDGDWSNLRIFTYYLPIWICIALSGLIYVAIGYSVFKQRNQLRNVLLRNPDPPGTRDSGEKDLFANAAVMGVANREVRQVTTFKTISEPIATHGSNGRPTSWFKGPAEEQQANLERPPVGMTQQPGPMPTTITSISAEPPVEKSIWRRVVGSFNHWRAKFHHMDPVKLSYLRTSFVFAVSVLITWTPSSINRVHDLVRPNEFSFGLNLASSIVLPLQGLWNAVIFFSTTWPDLCDEVRVKVDYHFKGIPKGRNAADAVRSERERLTELQRRVTGQRDNAACHSELSQLSVTTTLSHDDDQSRKSSIRVMRESSIMSI